MKKVLLVAAIAYLNFSCVTLGVIGIKGKYQEGPVRMIVEDSYENTWDMVIDFISDIGLNVKMVDKNSGLVISDPTSFTGLSSVEDRNGVILNKDAYIVTSRTNDPNVKNPIKSVDASYNLRVKAIDDKKSSVSILLYNIRVQGNNDLFPHKGKSTGNFEKWVLDNLYNQN